MRMHVECSNYQVQTLSIWINERGFVRQSELHFSTVGLGSEKFFPLDYRQILFSSV